jgi:hypothetical protein
MYVYQRKHPHFLVVTDHHLTLAVSGIFEAVPYRKCSFCPSFSQSTFIGLQILMAHFQLLTFLTFTLNVSSNENTRTGKQCPEKCVHCIKPSKTQRNYFQLKLETPHVWKIPLSYKITDTCLHIIGTLPVLYYTLVSSRFIS